MPMIAVDPNWGGIFCCDGAGTGDICDPWCEYAEPAEQERFIQSQHLGYVDMSIYPPDNRCDDLRCCGEEDFNDD